jgi:RNA polymerase sigma-70 factor, ECF subfamily
MAGPLPTTTDGPALPLDFDQVYEEWFHEVSRWARAFGGLDADLDDLTQEVFVVVSRKLDRFDGQNLGGFLYRITQKTVSDYRRRSWFRRYWSGRRPALELVADRGPDPAAGAERREAEQLLKQILARISPVRRSAFILYEIEGYSGEEISELEGVPVGTVYTRLHHARRDFLAAVSDLTSKEVSS